MSITLRQIEYVVATAETGQVSQAASRLNISQSAITIAIRQLENMLGTSLFIRQPNGMVLTNAGHHFLAHAYDILSSVEAAREVRHWDSGLSGTLNVAATYTIMSYFLPAKLQHFAKLYPNVRIQLKELSRSDVEKGLLDGSIDLAVLIASNVRHEGIVVRHLFDSKRQLWISAEHELASREVMALRDLAQEKYVMLTVDEAADVAHDYWQQNGLTPNVVLHTTSIEAVRSMVGYNSGIAILSDMVYWPWSLERKRIVRIPVVPPPPSMGIGLAWQKARQLNELEKAFCDYLIQHTAAG